MTQGATQESNSCKETLNLHIKIIITGSKNCLHNKHPYVPKNLDGGAKLSPIQQKYAPCKSKPQTYLQSHENKLF
jgi:hypothetical protein